MRLVSVALLGRTVLSSGEVVVSVCPRLCLVWLFGPRRAEVLPLFSLRAALDGVRICSPGDLLAPANPVQVVVAVPRAVTDDLILGPTIAAPLPGVAVSFPMPCFSLYHFGMS